jgi:hypothetical protein
MKKGKLRRSDGGQTDKLHPVPNGIIARLTRDCGGNLHGRNVVAVTHGPFAKETDDPSPLWRIYQNHPNWAAKDVINMETDSLFFSGCRPSEDDIPHTRNNWICYGFNQMTVPTHYADRTNWGGPGAAHPKSWLVETSVDGKRWRQVAREENTEQPNGEHFAGTFPVAGAEKCSFIRLVNIGRSPKGTDILAIPAWEIFGTLIE